MSAARQFPQRVEKCDAVLRHYTNDVVFTSLIDFLADARHWCDHFGEDFAKLDRQAYQHYIAELNYERKQP